MHIFGRHQDGIQPYGGPILDAAGDVYGTTFNGGGGTLAGCSDGCGKVYVLIPGSGERFNNWLSEWQGMYPALNALSCELNAIGVETEMDGSVPSKNWVFCQRGV
jgi:hypothetical protein